MHKPFVVPEGVVFLVEDDGVTIENQGDVVLHTDFGGRLLKRIVSHHGNVELHGRVRAGTLQAGGSLRCGGTASAESVHADRDIEVAGDAVFGSVHGGGSVHVAGSAQLGRATAAGSIAIDGALKSGALECGGLVVGGDAALGSVSAANGITLLGSTTAVTLRGNEIDLRGPSVTARGVQGARRVSIGGAKLSVDAILAPEVHLDGKTSGRVTVIESNNELGPNAVKGCFRLTDYAEMVGDTSVFLADRGLVALGAAMALPAEAAVDHDHASGAAVSTNDAGAPAEEPPAPAAHAEPADDADAEPAAAAAGEAHAEPEPTAEPEAAAQVESTPDVVEVVEDEPGGTAEAMANDPASGPAVVVVAPPSPKAVSMQDADPLAGAAEHPMHAQLAETVQKIVDCYANQELPLAVEKLRDLVAGRKYTEVRAEITNIWSELLKFHQKKGMRIAHQVTNTFNSVNSMVKKM
ncbi:MAG: hypothetical protein FJ090_13635 [Deltaproteobacteria bacterium]|nr:hypothetical protein [Deltaproteobacteria bacterium]